jgi:hypothetical protein
MSSIINRAILRQVFVMFLIRVYYAFFVDKTEPVLYTVFMQVRYKILATLKDGSEVVARASATRPYNICSVWLRDGEVTYVGAYCSTSGVLPSAFHKRMKKRPLDGYAAKCRAIPI